MSRNPIPHINPQDLDAALASLREKILRSEMVSIESRQGTVEVPTFGPNREFMPGALRIVITINEHLGGLDGTVELTPAETLRWIVREASNA